MKYLVDSVVVIDHFNGVAAATDFLADHGSECALSVITRAEALAAFDDDTETLAPILLDSFETLPITTQIADFAARMRRHERWTLPDAIQAPIAVHHGLTLVTRNTRDFAQGSDPRVLVPYRMEP